MTTTAQGLLNNLLEDDIIDEGYVMDPNTEEVSSKANGNDDSRSSIYPSMWRMAWHTTKCHLESMSESVYIRACLIFEISSHWRHLATRLKGC